MSLLRFAPRNYLLRHPVRHFPSGSERFYSTPPKKLPETDSFAMNLFRGRLSVGEMLPFPKVLKEEQTQRLQEMVGPTAKFLESEVDAAKNDLQGKFDEKVLSMLGELGVYGLQAPEIYNGSGLNNTEYARLVTLVGHSDLSLGVHLGAHQSIGYKGILLYGTEKQKAKYVPDLAAGKKFAAYCLTEPDSGSDVSSIQAKAELSPDGKHYILNGTKVWISNGGLADIFTVFAKTPVTGSDGKVTHKITAFIVERGFGGLTNGQPEKKMGINASNTTTIYLDNCKVPVENVLGPVGEGFKIAVNILNQGRFSMSAVLSGTMREVIKQTLQYTSQRKQFGRTLNEFQNVQEKLTNMAIRQYVTEAMAYMLSGMMDLGAKDFQVEAAMSKIYSSESAWYCVDEAIQIHGGTGYMKDTNLERILRDLRVFRIFEGANDILRLFVSLTGLNYAGKHLAARAQSPFGAVGLAADRCKRVVGLGGSGSSLTKLLPPPLAEPAALAGNAIDEFGAASTLLLSLYRKEVIEEQFRLTRLADAAIQIFAMVCALSRSAKALQEHSQLADYEVHLAKLVCYQGSKTIDHCLSELDKSADGKCFDLIQSIHGGTGYMKDTNLERILRDLRVFRIFEGANDILRLFVSLTGLNYAGKHLAARAQSPFGAVGLAADRCKRVVGLGGSGSSLTKLLPPPLAEPAALAGNAIDAFGAASTLLLSLYRKEVIEEQFRLTRLADAAIQIFAMVCALSRSAKALQDHSQLADYEVHLAKLVCYQASKTIDHCLSELDKSADGKCFDLIQSVSSRLFQQGDVVCPSPLGF